MERIATFDSINVLILCDMPTLTATFSLQCPNCILQELILNDSYLSEEDDFDIQPMGIQICECGNSITLDFEAMTTFSFTTYDNYFWWN